MRKPAGNVDSCWSASAGLRSRGENGRHHCAASPPTRACSSLSWQKLPALLRSSTRATDARLGRALVRVPAGSTRPPAGFLDPEQNGQQPLQLATLADSQVFQEQTLSCFQAHLEGLEAEKTELGRQINHLQLENRDLLHVKTSLSLEVATYR